jgi:hypothetical protein
VCIFCTVLAGRPLLVVCASTPAMVR